MCSMETNLLTPTESNQIRAMEIYLNSATFENGYTPLSFKKIEEQLKTEGLSGGKSTIQRWAKIFNFEKHLELKINTVILEDQGEDIKNKAITKSTQETVDRFKVNGELIDDLYTISSCFVDKVKENIANNQFNREDIKLAKDLLVITTGREDKMLDRLAAAPKKTLSSAELMDKFDAIEVEIDE